MATPLAWSLAPSRATTTPRGRVKDTLCMTVTFLPGTPAIEQHFRTDLGLSTESMLAAVLTDHTPGHPVLRAWRESRGFVDVTLAPQALDDLGGQMHTALRKLAESHQSVITWNALHQLHPADNEAIWAAARQTLETAFQKPKPPQLRVLALALKAAVTAACEDRLFPGATRGRPAQTSRTDAQTFALRAMQAACELTAAEEWMYGWLGYSVEVAAAP